MRETKAVIVKLEKVTFRNKQTGEVTYKTKITYGLPVETTEYVAGLQLWESYTDKTISNLKNCLNQTLKVDIQEIQDGNRLRLRLSKIANIEV